MPGTTRAPVTQGFGPFVLVDTPGFSEVAGEERTRLASAEVAKAEMVVLLLDAAAGVRQSDLNLHASLRSTGVRVVVALNKTSSAIPVHLAITTGNTFKQVTRYHLVQASPVAVTP